MIGCLQLDPTAIVARNHLLVLFSRLGPFDPKLVDSLLWDERRFYEYWAHQASIVPTEDRELHAALPPPWADPRPTAAWMTTRARFPPGSSRAPRRQWLGGRSGFRRSCRQVKIRLG